VSGLGDRDLAVAYVPDHAERMLRKMPTALQGQSRWGALVRGVAVGIQELEDVLFNLLDQRTLDAAKGAHLRRWAAIVGQPADALTDEQLRRFIRVRLRVLRHARHGQTAPIDDLIDFARICTEAYAVRYFGLYPAGLNLTIWRTSRLSDEEVNATVRLLGDAIPAGKEWCLTEALPGSATSGGSWGTAILARRLYP
jgi:hypothetical protein